MHNQKQEQKLNHYLNLLKQMAWREAVAHVPLHEWQGEAGTSDVLGMDWQSWPQVEGDFAWGTPAGHHWFAGQLIVPQTDAGITPYLKLIAKNEILLGRTDPQCQVYLDGEICQAFDGFHRELYLPKAQQSAGTATIHINAYTAEIERQLGVGLVWCEQYDDAADLYYDLAISFEAARRLDENDARRHHLFNIIDRAFACLDLRERDASFSDSVRSARAIAKDLFGADPHAPIISAVGHTHIDVAWLWPISQTREKMVRSMSTACKLMDEYPDFVFMYNQCILFEWLKEDAPALFERIKKHVKSGQFEIEGAMWLEPDVNIISGESLVRQILRGVKFQQQEFGITPRVLWLPDTFGYTATIPQLMAQTGLDIFVTSKCSWNDTNRMPYDTFEWQGIDGTNVTAYLITAQTDDKGHRGDHRTDYGPHLDVSSTVGAWNRYEPKALNQNVLVPFGHGDGGGGPCKVMLENAKRLEKGVPGLPKLKLEGIRPYFDRLRQTMAESDTDFPRWVGELYLEYHRGTLTSLAKNKRNNANGEHLLRELELLSVLAKLNGETIDDASAEIDALWKILMLNQFHDILPGTSIPEVYEESDRDYAELFARGEKLRAHLSTLVFGDEAHLLNSVGVTRRNRLAQLEGDVPAIDFGAGPCAFQKIHRADGTTYAAAPVEKLAPFQSLQPVKAQQATDDITELSVSETHLENAFVRIDLNPQGDITSIFDKQSQRQLLRDGTLGNQLRVYEDKPLNWDAWDIDWFHEEKCWLVDSPTKIEVIETGPHRAAIRLERTYRQSRLVQIISLQADARQLEFDFFADWQESQSLLKAEFDFDVLSDQIKSQIQFGHVTRPTHRNTSWDQARFEASMHRWVAFEEADFAIGVLNDCKYGYSAKDTQFGLTLIKSGIYPHPRADQEQHICRYALTVSEGLDRLETINQRALDFAVPLQLSGGSFATTPQTSPSAPIQFEQENVVVHAAKISEDGQHVVFRLCEESGKRTRLIAKLDDRLGEVHVTNLLEQKSAPCVRSQTCEIELELKPFEILTLAAALV
ncbi:alpha-mannosidase [Maritalea mediterranea]|uniref:Glycosyl hydrolase-related protein n=1 Tax=Maritalea mediterranea TaxID=2909667 RepID=A0ABS9E3A9_9HYPH|nr:glycoside hydrolase family 38 C-terminal domain-containing protein [Maritalea mediterranea]MCF4097354.1 glycosyl hydrolase-related protein [Maritalea mediterranea]